MISACGAALAISAARPDGPYCSAVAEIIAAVNGENDGPEWIGVFRLNDGRYLVAEGSCDYIGWDCQAWNHMQVGRTLDDVLTFGLTPDQRERLGFAAVDA